MSIRMLLGTLVCVIPALCQAEDAPTPQGTIEVYQVGDLVTLDKFHPTATWSQVTTADPQAEHANTIAALERLATLIESVCGVAPVVVQPHHETLSIVVRHHAEGHREIKELLETLRRGNEPTIRLNCRLIHSPDNSLEDLSEEQEARASQLLLRKHLTPEEVAEIIALLAAPEDATYGETVELVNGRNASWGPLGRPATATCRAVPQRNSIQVRVDGLAGDAESNPLIVTMVADVPKGESFVYYQNFDGSVAIWLLTPSLIPDIENHDENAGVPAPAANISSY